MSDLTELEGAVLDALLDGPGEALAGLRQQAQAAQVTKRERTGVGFFTTLDVGPAPAIGETSPFRLGDVVVDLEGLDDGAGFVLFIRDGRLSMLEAYTFGNEPWPQTEEVTSVKYTKAPRILPSQVSRPASS